MTSYAIVTPNGLRHYQADDREHAREQHRDAFPVAGYEPLPAWFKPGPDGTMRVEGNPQVWTAKLARESEHPERVIVCVPEPIRFYSPAEHGMEGAPYPMPADCWLGHSDGSWTAQVAAFNLSTWWEGSERDQPAELSDWFKPIDQVPTSGALTWCEVDGTQHTDPAEAVNAPTRRVGFSPWVSVDVRDGKVIDISIDWSDSMQNVYLVDPATGRADIELAGDTSHMPAEVAEAANVAGAYVDDEATQAAVLHGLRTVMDNERRRIARTGITA